MQIASKYYYKHFSPYVLMFMIYKFHKNLFFGLPKIFELVVIGRKKCNNFHYSFCCKSCSVNIKWLDSYQLPILVFQVNLSCSGEIIHNIPYSSVTLIVDPFISYFIPEHFWRKQAYYACL